MAYSLDDGDGLPGDAEVSAAGANAIGLTKRWIQEVVIRLGLLWNERLSLVMDDKLQLKRFKFVDINEVAEEAQSEDPDEQFDLDFVLMSGELRKLLDELMSALGAD